MTRVGAYIKHLRTLREWSLRDLGRMAGISASTLSRIENGEDFMFSHLESIAMMFGLGAGDLLVAAGYTATETKSRNQAASSADYVLRVTVIDGVQYVEIARDKHA